MSKLLMCALSILVVAGCASTGGGMSETAKIQATLDAWQAGVQAKNIDQIVGQYSEDFSHPEYGNKASFRQAMVDLTEQGAFDGAKVAFDKTKIAIDGSDNTKATAGPVELQASFGGASLNFNLKKEGDGVWRFTGMNVELY